MLEFVVITGIVSMNSVTSVKEVSKLLFLLGVAPVFWFLRPVDNYCPLEA